MDISWEDNFFIRVGIQDGATVISANKAGLQSLIKHLHTLAEEPPGSHIHLDEHNALEDGSTELIIERS